MLDDAALDAAQRQVDEWLAAAQRRAAAAEALLVGMQGIRVDAEAGREVELTLDAFGRITRLRLDERLTDRPAAATAALVLEALDDAYRALAVRLAAGTEATVGADSPLGHTMRATVDALATPDPHAPTARTARSADGSVQVSVQASGRIHEIHLDEAIRERAMHVTAEQIVVLVGDLLAPPTIDLTD